MATVAAKYTPAKQPSSFDFFNAFPDEDTACEFVINARWPDGVTCPRCGYDEVYTIRGGKLFKCKNDEECGKQFSCRIGTVMEESRIPLRKWLFGIYLFCIHAKGVASTRLAEQIGITQKSAWFMAHRMREAFAASGIVLDGEVKVDESYIGGKEGKKGTHPSYRMLAKVQSESKPYTATTSLRMDAADFGSATRPLLHTIPTTLQPAGIETFADLFCGIGGFHYAAEHLGLRCVFASDIDEAAQAQYEHNFAMRPAGDIKKVKSDEVPDHDILFGGFPCQPFSIIGEREGLDDSKGRGTLIYEVARILKAKQPKAFVLENVKQLSTLNAGKVMEVVLDAMEEAGYYCTWQVLNALHYGLPHKRERTIIVGFPSPDTLALFKWPKRKDAVKPLSQLLESDPDKRHFVSDVIRAKRRNVHRAKVTPSIWHENKAGNINSHPFSCALRAGASHNYLLVNGERRLTPREQLRLQGFPERFEVIGSDSQIRKQVGNAVPVPMIQATIWEVLLAAAKDQIRLQETRAVPA